MIIERVMNWIDRELQAPEYRAMAASTAPQPTELEQQTHALLQGMRERGLTDVSVVEELETLHREVNQTARLQGLPTEHPYEPASLIDVYA